MKPRAIDVSHLPDYAFGHRNVMWWGGAALMAIEGMMFALLIVSYVYLKGRSPEWPPGYFAPVLFWGTLNTAILLSSAIPNHFAKKAAERMDLRRLRLWLAIAIGFGVSFGVIRIFEFSALNVWWDSNAYGSIVWVLLGLHTAHLLTDYVDSVVLTLVLFVKPSPKRFVDVSENAFYWYFVVISWIPIYVVLYFGPWLL
jgi:cytochrome c oxidase subunit 3